MTRETKKPGGAAPGNLETDQQAAGATAAATVADDSNSVQQLRRRREAALRLPPLECGHRDPLDCARADINRQRARWHITLGSIRAHLDEQPTRRARITAARRWCTAVMQMAWEGGR